MGLESGRSRGKRDLVAIMMWLMMGNEARLERVAFR